MNVPHSRPAHNTKHSCSIPTATLPSPPLPSPPLHPPHKSPTKPHPPIKQPTAQTDKEQTLTSPTTPLLSPCYPKVEPQVTKQSMRPAYSPTHHSSSPTPLPTPPSTSASFIAPTPFPAYTSHQDEPDAHAGSCLSWQIVIWRWRGRGRWRWSRGERWMGWVGFVAGRWCGGRESRIMASHCITLHRIAAMVGEQGGGAGVIWMCSWYRMVGSHRARPHLEDLSSPTQPLTSSIAFPITKPPPSTLFYRMNLTPKSYARRSSRSSTMYMSASARLQLWNRTALR